MNMPSIMNNLNVNGYASHKTGLTGAQAVTNCDLSLNAVAGNFR